MLLTHKYLQERHAWWIKRIGDAGIWQPSLFKPVVIALRGQSRSCHGKFQRKPVTMNGITRLTDFLIIYQQHPDIPQRDVDETLVHEMIHQYIFQTGLKDSGPHGHIFRDFMHKINASFPGELNISISGTIQRQTGPGPNLHRILILKHTDGYRYCCKINPSRTDWFLNFLRLHGSSMGITGYHLCETNDRYFDFSRACTTRLHGERLTETAFRDLCRNCNFRPL